MNARCTYSCASGREPFAPYGGRAGATYPEVLAAAERDNAPFCASGEIKKWVESSMGALQRERGLGI